MVLRSYHEKACPGMYIDFQNYLQAGAPQQTTCRLIVAPRCLPRMW